jgi:hypothetical protein
LLFQKSDYFAHIGGNGRARPPEARSKKELPEL